MSFHRSHLRPTDSGYLQSEFALGEASESRGELRQALHHYELAASGLLALSTEELLELNLHELLPLAGRTRMRQRLGMEQDVHDSVGVIAELMSNREAQPGPMAAVRVGFARAEFALTAKRGLTAKGRTESEHYADEEREMRAHSAENPEMLIATVTVSVEEHLAFAQSNGLAPADDETFGELGPKIALDEPERVSSWPPERNKPCWCGSARKYKKCCGSPAAR